MLKHIKDIPPANPFPDFLTTTCFPGPSLFIWFLCWLYSKKLPLFASFSLTYVHLPLPQNQFILCFIFLICYPVHMDLILTNNWGLSFPSLVKESSGSHQCLLTNAILKEIISPNYHLMFRLNPIMVWS